MDKLVERESATRNPLVAAPALAVQFFLIPLAVVGVTVLVYVGFRSLLTDDRVAAGLSGRDPQRRVRPPLAGRLRAVAADGRPEGPRRPDAGAGARQGVRGVEEAIPQVRRYLALAIGRLDPPLPPEAVAGLTARARRPRQRGAHQRDLGARLVGRPGGRPRASCRSISLRPDAGIRKMVVYALGALPGDAQIDDAAHGAPGHGARRAVERRGRAGAAWRHEGVAVLRQMLDRAYVEQTVKRDVRQDEDQDPIADVMISGLRAARGAQGPTLRPRSKTLSQQDRSMKVRQAALEALKVMG